MQGSPSSAEDAGDAANSPSFEQLFYQAKVHESRGEVKEAEEVHKQMLVAYPNRADGWLVFGQFLIQQKRFREALPYLEECLKLDPKSEFARLLSAEAWIELGEHERALEFLAAIPKKEAEK
jgi:tetratricopeptide (TPR) repeat protein